MPPRAAGSPFDRASNHRFSATESRKASLGIGKDERIIRFDARCVSLTLLRVEIATDKALVCALFFPIRRWKIGDFCGHCVVSALFVCFVFPFCQIPGSTGCVVGSPSMGCEAAREGCEDG